MSTYTFGSQDLFPFGVREIRVVVGATNVALAAGQTVEAHEVLASAEINGDDAVAAVHSYPIKVEGKLTAAGMPLYAYSLITGRTIATTGATPTRVSTMSVAQGDSFPYFKMFVRAVTEDGGDVWNVLYKCKLTDGQAGQFAFGEFRMTDLTFTAVPDSGNSNKIWDIATHETAVSLPTS